MKKLTLVTVTFNSRHIPYMTRLILYYSKLIHILNT